MPALSAQMFGLLASLVEERVGLHWGLADVAIFGGKLQSRLVETGFDSVLDYYYYLRYDPGGDAEFQALVDSLVVGETYLFRETGALEAVIEHVVRPAIDDGRRARIWSAGCATGEEPFTLAMMLANAKLLDDVDLTATDVSGRSLARARSGLLPSRSLRALSPESPSAVSPVWRAVADRWLTREPGGGARIAEPILRAVHFSQTNLVDANPSPELVDVDLILCRNVLIYFRDAVVEKVVTMFAQRLRPTGRLAVGASESLLRFGTLLDCEERAGAFLYAKERHR